MGALTSSALPKQPLFPPPLFFTALAAALAFFLGARLASIPSAPCGALQGARSRYGVLRVALLGDSITLGQLCGSGGYEKYLAPALGDRHYVLRSFAANGLLAMAVNATGDDAALHAFFFPRAFSRTPLWPAAQSFDADAYVIMLGTNDASALGIGGGVPGFVRLFGDLIAQLRALPSAPEVFVAIPPPAGPNAQGVNETAVNGVLRLEAFPALAAATGVPLVDVFSALGGGNASAAAGPLFCDNLHPTALGAKRIAKAVYEALWRRLVVKEGWPPFSAAAWPAGD